MEIAGLVLAAGAGRRFGMPKALVPWRGRPLVVRAAATSRAAGLARTVVVVGAAAGRVRAAAPDLDYVENPAWQTGMASSLRAGLAALAGTPAAAVVVLLADMPGVTPAAVRRVTALASPTALVTGGYAGRRGHPVLLGRDHWEGVAGSATGDRGARDYLRTHAGEVRVVPVGDVADDLDLDVPGDMRALDLPGDVPEAVTGHA
ncbi:nucleotidyltransferase family protein [Couchioplanes caeruleus]|uniref:Molybdopterin-guanine dinucleotide biosynthesis protein A n=2 Tax=Couchioplanes caeruleus TaxID=56438 RepID=A0A1K0FKQ8_9ACTN|nr:nucleotidyltransferase family protein [Couchioplanes caeruleus]OJF13437.1 molybdopterin-guanine dinucleotide biosynthesis protein A [Couchioplanes caeruleus subsp. caeruleus]ROP32955.1 nicotine blue oxidoreductase [Couchioplanes caeruleus]